MPYMPIIDETTAQAVSRAVALLTRPAGEHRDTEFALSWVITPDNKAWLRWESEPLPVWPNHQTNLQMILNNFVLAEKISQESADALFATISNRLLAAQGGIAQIALDDVTPAEWITLLISDDEFAELYPAQGIGAP